MPSITSAVPITGEPQFGQKLDCVSCPLSPLLPQTLSSPVTVNDGVGTATTMEYEVPVVFWQSLQWHKPENTGSASEL
jgi:hypothetical protein